MADKQIVELSIVELPELNQVTNETLIPVYQPGAMSNAQKMTGLQFRSFAEQVGAAAGEQAAGGLARGGTFTPHFDPATGLLSWTNDLGLPNPDPVQLEGVSLVNGKTGAVVLSAADVGAVALDGSNPMTGSLYFKSADNGSGRIGKSHSDTADYGTVMRDTAKDGSYVSLTVSAKNDAAVFTDKEANSYRLLHLGNYKDHALARDGSNSMTGDLTLSKNGPTVTLVDVGGLRKLEIRKNSASVGTDFDYGSYIRDWSNDGRYAYLKMFAASQKLLGGFLSSADGTAKEYELLHTGNKPTGSYTGNGDATQRTIETGGIGRIIAIRSGKGAVIVFASDCALAVGSSAGAISYIPDEEVNISSSGGLNLATTNKYLNESGVTYTYQVL